MTLDGVGYPLDQQTLDMAPLRGDFPGNVWGPPEPGMNVQRCGGLGNRANLGKRFTAAAGTIFKLAGTIHRKFTDRPRLYFSIRFGDNPSFLNNGYPLLSEAYYPEMSELPHKWVLTLQIPADSYNGNATVQVEYRDGNVFYQCVDLQVTGGVAFPEGIGPRGTTIGSGSSEFVGIPSIENEVVAPPPTDPDSDEGLSTFQILMIALFGLVLLVFCVVLVNYKAGQDKDEVQPELAPSERVHKVPDRIIQKPPDDSEEEKEEGPFIDEDGEVEELELGLQLSNTEDSGDPEEISIHDERHFHFKYIEER